MPLSSTSDDGHVELKMAGTFDGTRIANNSGKSRSVLYSTKAFRLGRLATPAQSQYPVPCEPSASRLSPECRLRKQHAKESPRWLAPAIPSTASTELYGLHRISIQSMHGRSHYS